MISLPQASSVAAPHAEGASDATALAVYSFLEALVGGRSVADVWPLLGEGRRRLERAGARRVLPMAPSGPPLPLEDGSVDVVLCLSRFSSLTNEERGRWLAELARVMSPTGFCVLRAQCLPGQETEGAADESGPLTQRTLAMLLGAHFSRADIVAETPFLGVSFFVPGTEEVAVNEDLSRLASSPAHNLVFCGRAEQPTWQFAESLLVPVEGLGELELRAGRAHLLETELGRLRAERDQLLGRCEELAVERDNLREAVMTALDQRERHETALGSLRRETERHIKQISDDAGALELATLERERAERRAERAERAATELEVALKRREVEVAQLEREVTHLRGRTGKGEKRAG
jgi:hypothetical protein